MTNPCDKCKRKPNCPERCYPKLDYERAVRKRRTKCNRLTVRRFYGGSGGITNAEAIVILRKHDPWPLWSVEAHDAIDMEILALEKLEKLEEVEGK